MRKISWLIILLFYTVGLNNALAVNEHLYLTAGGGISMPQKKLQGIVDGGSVTKARYIPIKREHFANYYLAFGGAIDEIRAEIEYFAFTAAKLNWSADIDLGVIHYLSSKLKSKMFMINVYCDFNQGLSASKYENKVIPYIGIGIGAAHNQLLHTYMSYSSQNAMPILVEQIGYIKPKNHTTFAWNAILGLRYNFKGDYFINFQYRMTSLGNVQANSELIKTSGNVYNL
jgi:hypothetical protein